MCSFFLENCSVVSTFFCSSIFNCGKYTQHKVCSPNRFKPTFQSVKRVHVGGGPRSWPRETAGSRQFARRPGQETGGLA